MPGVHLLDRVIGNDYPSFATDAEVRAFEQIPYAERIAAQSTYEALKLGAAHDPDAPALQFLANADPADQPVVISYRDFVGRVTQAANLFTELGVGPDDVVSFLLPLVPDAFVTLFGAEAAGIANPVNPLLEPHQIAEILDAANTKVLVALGPMPGTDIWQKVEQVRGKLTNLKAIVQVHGAGDAANGIHSFDELIKPQPSDRLVSGRKISGSDIAAYFHTGGTTGTPKLVRHTHANQVYQAWAVNLMLKQQARHQSAVRHAALSCRRLADAGAGHAVRRRLARRAVAVGLAQSQCRQERLAADRALQARRCRACRPCWPRRSTCRRATPTSRA